MVKTFTGNALPASQTYSFTFTITADSDSPAGTPLPNPDHVSITVTNGNTSNLSAAFQNIAYTAADVYKYTVTETAGGSYGGISIDNPHTVEVTVTDSQGQLTANVKIDGAESSNPTINSLPFVNDYTPGSTSLQIPIRKEFSTNSHNRPEGYRKTFTFTLTGQDGAPMPGGATGPVTETIVDATGVGTLVGSKTFEAITYTAAGTYYYTLAETVETADGYTYDGKTRNITVVVSDSGGGTLTNTWTVMVDGSTVPNNPIVFVNEYVPVSTTLQIPVKKVLSIPAGMTLDVSSKTFTFTLTALNGAPVPADLSLTLTWPDHLEDSFGEIEYIAAGTYYYTLSETNDATPGFSYDTVERNITVTVTDDQGTLTPSFTATHTGSSGEVTETDISITFTNYYDKPTVNVTVNKIWDDADDQDGIRPDSITVTLHASYEKDGSTVEITAAELRAKGVEPEVTLTADAATGTWPDEITYTWEGLDKYALLDYEISYTVTEAEITYAQHEPGDETIPLGFAAGYTTVIVDVTPASAVNAFVYDITNSHVPETMSFKFLKQGQSEDDDTVYVALPGVTFGLFEDAECTTPAQYYDDAGTLQNITSVSDSEGWVVFNNVRFTVDDSTTPPTVSARIYYMKEISLGDDNEPIYWDNPVKYKVTLTPAVPASGETPASPASVTITYQGVDDPTTLYTGVIAQTDPDASGNVYTIIRNDLAGYQIKLQKLDHTDYTATPSVTTPVVGAKFDLYRAPDPTGSGTGSGTGGTGSGASSTPGAPNTLPTVTEVTTNAAYTKLNTQSLVSDATGWLDLDDLRPGTYYLVETEAPFEYYKLAEPVEIIVRKTEVTVNYNIVVIDGETFTNTGFSTTVTPTQGQTAAVEFQITDQPKYGELLIIKQLTSYQAGDTVTFTFDVVGYIDANENGDYEDSERVYSNVAALTIGPGSNYSASELMTHVPAGAHVVVSERNTGSHYQCTIPGNPPSQTTTIVANLHPTVPSDPGVVVFSNTYIPNSDDGYGIENHFAADTPGADPGGWHYTGPYPAPPAA